MGPNGSYWVFMRLYEIKWLLMGFYAFLWVLMRPHGFQRVPMFHYKSLCVLIGPYASL